ncbi:MULTISPECIES: error-prone DNA polymerase [Hydrocarboniphaga]|uniref:Error-prone DNA polymerase n=1 Tax=Hydrocarboniphaga effusa AP103 TaxID=1172194 RepID=I7ZJF2_9GAMM|nr:MULTISPECIES: error-prone DNA polymerase [Hydrocarboniphaga]EIT71897.1 error-prone DNA polymerase [Hydrocarboniphaga effusa AP103]MDZ4077401.1 error-prone DNA polymerase [Hydrocarboniphaga sp.]
MSGYAELHCVSNFTFLRGASDPRELVRQAHALGYAAIAITDECSLAGIVRAYEASRETGLALIVGSEFRLADGNVLTVLVTSPDSYTELCGLITEARRRSKKGRYSVDYADFVRTIRHGLVLWSPPWLPRGANVPLPETAAWLREHFDGRAWIAWERTLHPQDRGRFAKLRELAEQSGLPLTAAGDVHMHIRERGALQQVVTCIRNGCSVQTAGQQLYPNHERHLRPLHRLKRLYPPELLQQSLVIAERCTFRLNQLRYEYPHELVPAGLSAIQHLRNLTEAGIRRRWPDACPEHVRALIDKEYRLIEELGYEHFFLTVEDIVREARRLEILCQGRGSAANSAVCYALGVTEVDPARLNMLFERFVSKERNEPPDIDIDFEHQRREEIIQYVYTKYGRERAAIAATVITYRKRSAIRDVGRALGFTLEQVDALAKSLTWWDDLGRLQDNLRTMGFDMGGELIQHFVALVDEIVGFPRHLSQHVGGFVISHHPLHTLVPVENASMEARTIIQWDKDDLDTMGLLKVDVLALGMLSAVRRACELVSRFRGKPFSFGDIPAEDPKTYDMIGRAETVGVFQVESRAQMSMLPRLKPRRFYDLVIEVAIIRPGPIQGGMVHPYLRRRQGLEQVEYPSEALKQVLERTLGVPLFQEQVMEITMVAAGFSAGEADQVRRSMAAWKRGGDLEKYRDRLLAGMVERGYTAEFAEQIYQQILGFSGYGFPESHAASFALITYVSCWLRCNEHAAFVAALLNSQPMGFYSPSSLVNDARRAGVVFRPVDVLHSDWDCTLEPCERGEPEVRLGLRMVGSLHEDVACRIVAQRNAEMFRSLEDMAHRVALDRGSLDLLAHAGALRNLTAHRNEARWRATGIERLPGALRGRAAQDQAIKLNAPSDTAETFADYQSIGLTLGQHPLSYLRQRLDRLHAVPAGRLHIYKDGSTVCVAGLVTHRQRPETASGVVFASLEDETGVTNLIIKAHVLDRYRGAALGSTLMVVRGELQNQQSVIHVIAKEIDDCSQWIGSLPIASRDFH